MLLMITPTSRVYKNVINEDYDEGIKISPEHARHQVHKGSWGISQPKRHHQELIMAITGPKCSLRDVRCPNPHWW
ncbi:hypothetical protein R3W88_022725 [Solanum pinnatisectum]|uniref:Uncharacterized protein n=1 Tax=Solanum pinnatisectum TaxID=50273 RepID=A0AAV9LX21_9SOLN|nr:hypothetical protein R3W88_022725 [Solanum pinnatisectum]